MARKRTPIEDTTRNKNFAAAFIYLKGKYRKELGTNILLAAKMGIDQDSITNVLHCHTAVSDNFIASFQEATGGMFNVHFMRGESDVMLAKDVAPGKQDSPTPTAPDPTFAALLASKDDTIASKDETIAALRTRLADMTAAKDEIIAAKDALIATLRQQMADLRMQAAWEKGLSEDGRSLSAHAERSGIAAQAGK